ncbi:MAG TPA: DPP IV N-terminal domain-containing protein [Bryobacteraceae bacterium]|jgi:dipeptidyl aminopeptidase/acylaminoacyl peptidase|nr:DPP IV N-terminal domain-containing protein [Bryobacteraceae bacterium]
MHTGRRAPFGFLATVLLASALGLPAQVTRADYERAAGLRTKYQNLALNVADQVTWIGNTHRFTYRRTVRDGHEFMLVDAETQAKKPAFDHEKLAAALSTAAGEKYTAHKLPFTDLTFVDNESAIQVAAAASIWRCTLADYACTKTGTARPSTGSGGRPPADTAPDEGVNDVYDGMVDLSPYQQGQNRGRGAQPPPVNGPPPVPDQKTSPDGKYEAVIRNFNVFLRSKGETEATPLSFDGSEGNYYTMRSIAWSPDSKYIAAYHVRPGYKREVHYIESSPADQLQPKHSTRDYAKPGDTLDIAHPVLFEVATKKQTNISNALFPNPYSLSNPVWWRDSRGFTFDYNQRGHQVYRVIEVDIAGNARALITETSRTFINYRPLTPNQRETGKMARININDGKEIIWSSERDGWGHLYLYDGITGKVKNQITKGEWVVRSVDKVDEVKRQIWFQASGMNPGKDPYFNHYYRINFDGTGLTIFTEGDGVHSVSFSLDSKYYVDIWSRVDLAPVTELRSSEDHKRLSEIERGDMKPLVDAGWHTPEIFTAAGRDGKTEIWGVIFRPANFNPSKKYPVVEAIYAGPQGSFVPKAFGPQVQPLTELGFIVVQIDGMGTANRSKAFHEVAWKNLADAGFPDRIAWHKAVAAKYSHYDISRVGIFGTSAGGQNAMGALLFHPEFYTVAVANSGCHDNRMDKIWWNELWMSWPVGPHYAASSNVDNAHRLQGKLLLVVGELDTNVDPSSTLQVVNALIKSNKKHDLLFVPGGGHGAGGSYAQRLLQDFFVHHLTGHEPPDWNREPRESRTGAADQ